METGKPQLYTLRSVQQIYGERTVLNIDALEVQQGEFLAILGPSGAGKSTLLRLLNFLEVPASGEIHYRGQRFAREHTPPLALRRQVTTVFQKPVLLQRTVAENVAYGLRLRGDTHAAAHILATLEQVGLAGVAGQPARTLSGGEAQRVALARAMVLRPTVLLLDEPTANLDPANVALIEQIVTRLNREQGTTIVLVTHNIFQAQRLAQRCVLLLDGRIVEVAPTAEFYTTPRDPRTAAFVNGDMVY